MRRRAVLVVEYDKESGRPILPETWESRIGSINDVRRVKVEVQHDDPA